MNDFNRGALQVPCLRLDYGFGEQWASVELGDGTGYVRLSDYENAKEENAKLRAERDYLLVNSNPTAAELRRVRSAWKNDRDENAKLRKLIQKVWKWERNGCYECPLEKDCKVLCVYDGDCGMAVEIEKELQEQGIEVK